MNHETGNSTTHIDRLALTALIVALKGLVISAFLFAAIYFKWISNTGYVWAAVSILVFEVPALGMSVASRNSRLGRAALALSSSVLIGLAIAWILSPPPTIKISATSSHHSRVATASVETSMPPGSIARNVFNVDDAVHISARLIQGRVSTHA